MKRITIAVIIALFFLSGCMKFSFSQGTKPEIGRIDLTEDIAVISEGTVNMGGTDFFPASFRIDAKGEVIYIDPVGIRDTVIADYIFITHSHPDHLSMKDIAVLSGHDTKIICTQKSKGILSDYSPLVMKPGDRKNFGAFSVTAVPAYNVKPKFLLFKMHPESDMNAGYVLEIDSIRIYHAGDTDRIPEMDNMGGITLALIPVIGDGFTMDPKTGADAVNSIRPDIAVPMHFDTGKGKAEAFSELVDDGISIILMCR